MKNCVEKLKHIIENVVLVDIENYLDDIFEEISKTKNASDENTEELKNIQEMRGEFKSILDEINNDKLSSEECAELYEEIYEMTREESEL